jgi:hypothetical protein
MVGTDGAGKRTAAAAEEKKSATGTASLVENEIESPLTTETWGWLGLKTPCSSERMISVCAMRPKLIQFLRAVHSIFTLRLTQRRLKTWIPAQSGEFGTTLEFRSVIPLRQRPRDERNCFRALS